MAVINYANRQVEFRIVFYGPPYAGKTTNLKAILNRIPNATSKLVTLQTGMDRTLFFEFAAPGLELIEGFATRFELYTVPGAVRLNVPRQLVLRDVDGIVFVADSQWNKLAGNVESMNNLAENLEKLRHRLDDIPMVIQYNKRDLSEVAPIDYLEYLLNNRQHIAPTFEAVATTGENVFECLDAISELVVNGFRASRPGGQVLSEPAFPDLR